MNNTFNSLYKVGEFYTDHKGQNQFTVKETERYKVHGEPTQQVAFYTVTDIETGEVFPGATDGEAYFWASCTFEVREGIKRRAGHRKAAE